MRSRPALETRRLHVEGQERSQYSTCLEDMGRLGIYSLSGIAKLKETTPKRLGICCCGIRFGGDYYRASSVSPWHIPSVSSHDIVATAFRYVRDRSHE